MIHALNCMSHKHGHIISLSIYCKFLQDLLWKEYPFADKASSKFPPASSWWSATGCQLWKWAFLSQICQVRFVLYSSGIWLFWKYVAPMLSIHKTRQRSWQSVCLLSSFIVFLAFYFDEDNSGITLYWFLVLMGSIQTRLKGSL